MQTKTLTLEDSRKSRLKSFLIRPVLNGLFGFLIFLGIIFLMKFLQRALDARSTLKLETEDVLLALIGFILLFLIAFLKNFQKDETR